MVNNNVLLNSSFILCLMLPIQSKANSIETLSIITCRRFDAFAHLCSNTITLTSCDPMNMQTTKDGRKKFKVELLLNVAIGAGRHFNVEHHSMMAYDLLLQHTNMVSYLLLIRMTKWRLSRYYSKFNLYVFGK